MKIAYQATVEEITQDLICSVEQTGLTKKYLRNRVVIVILASLATYVLLPNDALQGLQSVLLVGGFYIISAYAIRRSRRDRNCRQYVLRALKADAPIDAEYELDEVGITLRLNGEAVTLEWDEVDSVKEKYSVIEVCAQPSGMKRIPNRIFQSADQRDEWLSHIHSHTGKPGRD